MNKEEWIPMCEYLGMYEISSNGRVKNFEGKILSIQISKRDGYASVKISGKRRYVHRLVADYFILNPENKKEVNHIDLNRANNKIDNLEWCTSNENVAHSMKIYAYNNNGMHWKSKLTADNVKFIRSSFKKTHTANELAKMFNVSYSMIYYILRNDNWKNTNETGTIFRRNDRLVKS